MPGPKPLDPSSSPRAMLGAELRHKREEAGLTQEELGRHLFVSGSFIGQLEAGTRRMQMEYAVKIDEVLGTDGYFTRNCEAATKSKYPDHFAEAAEAEAVATTIKEYAPQLIPGLLQTKAYAWAVCRAYQPTAPEDVIEETVTARLERARLLDHPTTPLLWVVLDEAVLRRKTGGSVVMAEALWHMTELIRKHRDRAGAAILGRCPRVDEWRAQVDELRGRRHPRPSRSAERKQVGGRPSDRRPSRADLRSARGQRTVTPRFPGPDRISGGGLRE